MPRRTDDEIKDAVDRLMNGESKRRVSFETGIDRDTLTRHLEYRKRVGKPESKHHPPPGTLHVPVAKLGSEAIGPDLSASHTVLAIPDMHHPFAAPDTLDFLRVVRSAYKPTLVVCLGDEIDAHAFSKYPMDPDGLTAGQELQAAIESLIPFYREFPQMLVCESNHTIRPWKRSFDAGLPAAFLPTYSQILQAPDGWTWRPRHVIDGVTYMHGDSGRSGQYAHIHYLKAMKASVVIGHIHSFAGVNYEAQHFAVNAGCLIDESAYCFKYARNMITKPNLGCAIIHEGKWAEFVPMLLDNHGRWRGRI